MKFTRKWLIAVVLSTIVALPIMFSYPTHGNSESAPSDNFLFGVTFGGNTTEKAKILVDKVKGYTNLFIIANWDTALNETALDEVCQYAIDAGLYIMVYFNFIFMNISQLNSRRLDLFAQAGITPFHIPWLIKAYDKWGDKFLGVYILDEPGGKQIDAGHYSGFTTNFSGRNQTTFQNVANYSDAANRYIKGLDSIYYLGQLINFSLPGSIPNATGKVVPTFTADYALYWFDYLAGYQAVFAELGWNNSRAQEIALCRGAAATQGKDWGTIITWTYENPPYLENATETYQDMLTSYQAGAKYILLFNYSPQNQTNQYGTLDDSYFAAMEQFWNYANKHPRDLSKTKADVAFVLPKDYGWGMRSPEDKIWGLWPADDLSPIIYQKVTTLVKQFGLNLDIIYDDPRFNYTQKYSTLYYWNGTTHQSQWAFSDLLTSSALYVCVVVAVFLIVCIPSYLIIKSRKRSPQ